MLLTPIINKFISTFRIRQLYLSYDEVLPCTLPDTSGHITSIRIYNKGKDKETKIEVTFPHSSLCQILSTNYPGVSTVDSRLLIDRILPKQVIVLILYLNSTTPISAVIKPFIRSEDTNGKAYNDRRNVPPSLGPAVMGTSIAAAAFITFMYIAVSGSNIFYPYYALRYSSIMEQGFKPSAFSDNYLISSASLTSKPPITLNKPYIENSRIILPLRIKNITKEKITITISHRLKNEDYESETDKATKENKDINKRVQAWRLIDEKYGISSEDTLFISDLTLEPNEDKTLLLAHTILPTTTLNNFNFVLRIEKGSYNNPDFTDHYDFDIQSFNELPIIVEFLKSLQR